jgi:hypothetical protein
VNDRPGRRATAACKEGVHGGEVGAEPGAADSDRVARLLQGGGGGVAGCSQPGTFASSKKGIKWLSWRALMHQVSCSVACHAAPTYLPLCSTLYSIIWEHEIVERRSTEILVIFTIFYQKCTIVNIGLD